MYALAVKPLIGKLQQDAPNVKQVWYADDATGVGTCEKLGNFWDYVQKHGSVYGYHPNAAKTILVLKADHKEETRKHFTGTGVSITTEGTRHLGAAIGSRPHTVEYVTNKVRMWSEEIQLLADIAQALPHAAYCAYVHGFSSRWSFMSRTIPDIAYLLQPQEDTVQQYLLPGLDWTTSVLNGNERPTSSSCLSRRNKNY